MNIRSRSTAAIVALGITVSLGLGACADKGSSSSGGGDATASASAVDATSLLKSASEAAKAVTNAQFLIDVTGTVPNLPLTKATGGINVKPAVQAKGSAELSMGGKLKGDFVFIDGKMYSNISGRYVDYGDGASIFPVALLFDPAKGLPHVLSSISEPVAAGSETIEGAATTKIVGKVRSGDVSALTGTRVVNPETKDVPVPVTVWIQSSGEHQLVRLQLVPAKDAALTMNFSKWGEKVDVVKPSVPAPSAVPSTTPGTPRN
ncbi:LppX_LprAFG lipoprotein [Tsukamurella spumae]|uniref:LppX_LprAFG lipoprotein n=1 Tax=Tsukamurella spumae TaxID=44753 RepID=A0A846WYX6_9ACTN|nr:LppX_LprAFG lipoprotein [Tsukamurella spumae]NKY17465.1 LppX_LprAFG lipoprotein [Tsukamurella spumae]